MKKTITLLLSTISLTSFASQDEDMWKFAYDGEYEEGYKLLISRDNEEMNDVLLDLFYMAYVCYKTGEDEDPTLVFKAVDQYLEDVLYPKRD